MESKKILIGGIPAIVWGKASDRVFLYVHGKMSRKEHAESFADIAEKNGWQTLSFDLPEHGERAENKEIRCDVWNGKKDLETVSDYMFKNWKSVSLYACSLGAYFALQTFGNEEFSKEQTFEMCMFLSPIVDMKWLVEHMMLWSDVTKEQLEKEREIETPIDTLRWDYYQYILSHPTTFWPYETSIMYASEDNLQPEGSIRAFVDKFGANLDIAEGSQHAFMEEGDEMKLSRWIWGNLYSLIIRRHAGNQPKYGSENVRSMLEEGEASFLKDKNVLFLGSSVTEGAASLKDGIPEYFRQRFGCSITKEAVSGTTLVDKDATSYVSRLKANVDMDQPYDLMICQLSTNDATQKMPLGEIRPEKIESMDQASICPEDYDASTITGAMEYIIAYAKKHWNCPVYFYTGSRYDSEAYAAMVKRLYELAEKWQIGVLDLWNSDSFNDISDEERALYMADPIHPTKAGYMIWWCPEMERQIKEKEAM